MRCRHLMIAFIAVVAFAGPLSALTRYVSTGGNDTTGTGTLASPWLSIGTSCGKLSANDTLVILDGTYTGVANMISYHNSTQPPNGTGGNSTTVMAQNPGKVIIDGEGVRIPWDGHDSKYLTVDGIVFMNATTTGPSGDGQSVFSIIGNSSNYIENVKILRCGFAEAANNVDDDRCGKFQLRWARNCLVEDCYGWGAGHYSFIFLDSTRCIFRRVIDRYDRGYGGTYQNQGSFRLYGSTQCLVQNCMTIDCDQPAYVRSTGTNPGMPKMFFIGANGSVGTKCYDNTFSGCLLINCTAYAIIGLQGADDDVMGNTFDNCVFAGVVGLYWARGSTTATQTRFDHCLFANVGPDAINGLDFALSCDIANVLSATNSIFYRINNYAINNAASDYNCYYSNTKGNFGGSTSAGAHDYCSQRSNAIDPQYRSNNLSGGLKYPVRIENSSNLSGKASDAGAIGPTIMKKIGVSGTLYGETGYDTVTDDVLWPWPYEDIIQTNMKAYSYDSGNLSGNRGFCVTGQTLSNYVWSYLGNPMPTDISLSTATNMSAVALSSGSIALSWTDNSYAEKGFKVKRKKSGETYSTVATVTANTTGYIDAGLEMGVTYYYVVYSYDSLNNVSGDSNEASAVTLNISILNAPTILTATALSSATIRLSWNDTTGIESGYAIERKVSGGSFALLTYVAADTTVFDNTGLSAATTYYYRVRAYAGSNNTGYAPEASAVTMPPGIDQLNAPSDLTAAPQSVNSIVLNWKDNASVEKGFRIERRTGSDAYRELAVVGVDVIRYVDINLLSGSTYFYRICSYNDNERSAYTDEVSAVTLVDAVAVALDFKGDYDMKVVGSTESRGAVNPDKGETARIYFRATDMGRYECRIFLLTGELVWQDTKENVSQGMFEWLPKDMASGGYIVQIKGPGFNMRKKIAVIR